MHRKKLLDVKVKNKILSCYITTMLVLVSLLVISLDAGAAGPPDTIKT